MANILFINNVWYESLALMQLSAVAKQAGHQTFLFMDSGNKKKMLAAVKRIHPDVIGFSIMTGQHFWALKTATFLREKITKLSPLILFGGHHPTFVPDIIEHQAVDLICRGEGEGALIDLLDALDEKRDFSNIPNIWAKTGGMVRKNGMRPLINDLNSLPFLDRSLYDSYSFFHNNPNRMFVATRGCPYNCSFCFNQKYRELYNVKGPGIRRRSVHNVIEEVMLVKQNYKKTKIVRFQDDVFNLDQKWLFDFFAMFKSRVRLPFMCYIRAGLDSEEAIMRLKESGCVGVAFGIETGNEELRQRLLNKNVTNKEIFSTARLLKKYKIPFYAQNMFFIPGTTIENIWETVKMNQDIKADFVAANIFQPFPGTAVNEYLRNQQMLQDRYLDDMDNIFASSVVKTAHETVEKNICYFFSILVRFPWMTPFIRKIVTFRPNVVFLIFFKIAVGMDYWLRNRLTFLRFQREAFHFYQYRG